MDKSNDASRERTSGSTRAQPNLANLDFDLLWLGSLAANRSSQRPWPNSLSAYLSYYIFSANQAESVRSPFNAMGLGFEMVC